jgi:hypothetical protein
MIWNRLKTHMQSHDAGPKCNVTVVEPEFKKDGKEVTFSVKFGCGQCSKVFLTQAFLNQHVQGMHADK